MAVPSFFVPHCPASPATELWYTRVPPALPLNFLSIKMETWSSLQPTVHVGHPHKEYLEICALPQTFPLRTSTSGGLQSSHQRLPLGHGPGASSKSGSWKPRQCVKAKLLTPTKTVEMWLKIGVPSTEVNLHTPTFPPHPNQDGPKHSGNGMLPGWRRWNTPLHSHAS